MQNAGQFGPGAANTHPPSQFVPSEPSPNGGSTTSSLRQFRKKDVDKSHLEQQSAAPKPMSESHVTRIPASHSYHFPPASNDPYSYSSHQYAGGGYSSQVKYSDLNEATQPNPISTTVIQKPKPKEYMEVCNVQPQQQHLNNQQYSPDGGQQFMFKEHVQGYPAGFKAADSHFFAKEQHQYQQLGVHHPKFNPMMAANMRKFSPTPADNPFLNKLSKLSPSMARSIMSDHHLQESQAGYPAMDQRAMFSQQNHRYYPVSQPNPYTPNHNYTPYSNYSPSCSFARPPQIPPRYPPIERNISPGRRPFPSPEGMHLPPPPPPPPSHMSYHHPVHQKMTPVPANYPGQYRVTPPEYAQHYQHRRVPQDCYSQTCRTPPQFAQTHHTISEQEMQELTTEATTVSPSDSLRKFIETWADEEPAAAIEMNAMENKLRDDAPAGTVYMINANDVQYFEKNGIPIVTSDNGSFQLTSENYQYLLKNGVVDSAGMVRIIEATNKEVSETSTNTSLGLEKESGLQNTDVPKSDCMLANKQLMRPSTVVDGIQSGIENDERRVVIHQNTVLQPPATAHSLATPPPDNVSATKELVDKNCSPINLEELNQNLGLNDEAVIDQDSRDSIANSQGKSPGSKSMPIIDFFAEGHMVVAAANTEAEEEGETEEKPDVRSDESFESALRANEHTIKSEPTSSDDPGRIESEANPTAEDDAEAEPRRKRIFSVDDIIHNIGINVKIESRNDPKCPGSVLEEFLNKEIERSSIDQLCALQRIIPKDAETPIDAANGAEKPLHLDGTSVIIKLNEALMEIRVNAVAGRKVITVIPLSDSTVVDINDNYKTSSVACLRLSNEEIEENCATEDSMEDDESASNRNSKEEENAQDSIANDENLQIDQIIPSNLYKESLEIKTEFDPTLPDNEHSSDSSEKAHDSRGNSEDSLELSDNGVTADVTAKGTEDLQGVNEIKSEPDEAPSVIHDEQTTGENSGRFSSDEIDSESSAVVRPSDDDVNLTDILDDNKIQSPEDDQQDEPVIDEAEPVQIADVDLKVAQLPDSPRLSKSEEKTIDLNEVDVTNIEEASASAISPTYVSGTIFEDVLFGEPQEEVEIVPENSIVTETHQQNIAQEEEEHEDQFRTLFEEAPSSDKDSFYDDLVHMPLEDEVFIEDPPANEVIVSDPLEGTEAACHSPEIPLEQVSTTLEKAPDKESQLLSNKAVEPEVQILSPTSTNLEENGNNTCLKIRRHSSTDNDICTSSKVATKAAKKSYEGDLQVQHDIVSSSKKEECNDASKKNKKSKRQLYDKSPKETLKVTEKRKRRETEPENTHVDTRETAQDPDDEYVDFRELLQARKLKKLKKQQQAAESQKPQTVDVVPVTKKTPPLKTYSRTFREKKKCLGCKSDSVARKATIGVPASIKSAKPQNDSAAPKAPKPAVTKSTHGDDCPTSTSSTSAETRPLPNRDPRKKSKDQDESADVRKLFETKKRISLADYVSRKRKADTETTDRQEKPEAKRPFTPRLSAFEWEDSSSPETRRANVNEGDEDDRDYDGLINHTNNNNNNNNAIICCNKPVIDVNELTVGERNHEDRKLQEYKEKVDSQLNSLNIHIPIVKSPTKCPDGPTFFSRFLKNETLSPSEVQRIKEIISFKKSMQQVRKSPIVSRTTSRTSPASCTSENSPASAYEVRQDADEGRLFFKKVQGKRKEPPPPATDEESSPAKRNVDYSVFNRLGEDGLPKIIFKRNVRRDADKEPFVELVKLNLDELEKVEERYNVTVSQVM